MLAEFRSSGRKLRVRRKQAKEDKEESTSLTDTVPEEPKLSGPEKELIAWLMLFFVLCVGSEVGCLTFRSRFFGKFNEK